MNLIGTTCTIGQTMHSLVDYAGVEPHDLVMGSRWAVRCFRPKSTEVVPAPWKEEAGVRAVGGSGRAPRWWSFLGVYALQDYKIYYLALRKTFLIAFCILSKLVQIRIWLSHQYRDVCTHVQLSPKSRTHSFSIGSWLDNWIRGINKGTN